MSSRYSVRVLRRLLNTHGAELLVVLFGVVLRALEVRTHSPQVGYDFVEHEATVRWWTEHFAMPPLLLSRGSYHPQLYYALAGAIRRLGGGWRDVQAMSVVCGGLRLGLIWFAARRYLPHQRLARFLMLALAAAMPASVHLDGMMTQESLNNLLATACVVAVLELCRASAARRRQQAMFLGFVIGLALLVKVSALIFLAMIFVAAALELVQGRSLGLSDNVRRARAWIVAAVIAVSTSGGQYVHNRVEHGRAILDGWYRRPTADTERVGANKIDALDRRTLGFLFGFTTDILRFPYYPSGVQPAPRLLPVLVASSFCDYYNYRFGPPADVGYPVAVGGGHVGERATWLGRASVAGGLCIAVVTMLGWIAAFTRTLRLREVARPTVLSIPALGVLGQISFATQYPFDFEGVIKGVYFQFATVPLYAVFGTTVAWLFGHRDLRLAGVVAALSIVPVAAYSTYCALC